MGQGMVLMPSAEFGVYGFFAAWEKRVHNGDKTGS